MGQIRVNRGGLAISRIYQTAIGTAATLSHLMPCEAPNSSRSPRLYNATGEARGLEENPDQQEIRDETALSFPNLILNDVSLAAHLAYGLGSDNVTTPSGATNARQHAYSAAGLAYELQMATLQANMYDRTTNGAGSKYKNTKHLGCVVNSFTLSGGVGSGDWRISPVWQTAGAGAQNASSISGLTAPVYSPFRFRNTFCFVGPSFTPGSLALPSGSAPTGVELGGGSSYQIDISTKLLGASWTVNNNVDVEGGHVGSYSGGASELIRGQREQRLSLDLKYDPGVAFLEELRENQITSAVQTSGSSRAFSLGIYCWSNFALDSSGTVYYHAFSLFWPSVYLDGPVDFSNRGDRYAMKVPLLVGQNTTQNSVYAYQWSKEANTWANNM